MISNGVGLVTCNEDDQSPEQAPQLCSTLGTKHGFLIATLVAPVLLCLLMFAPIRSRVLVYAALALGLAQVLVFTMWALVAHGTISY
jgi:hypothetical protein